MMCSMNKRTMAFFLAMTVLLCAIPVAASAAETMDAQKPVSLTIEFLDDADGGKVPVDGAVFRLYHVASPEPDGSYALTGDFQNYPVEVNGLDAEGWRQLTSTLLNYVSADDLEALDTGSTGEDGKMSFPCQVDQLLPGLYLVNAEPVKQAEFLCRAEPFLVCLPGLDADGEHWIYDVSVRVKYTKEPVTFGETVERRVLKVWEGDAEQFRPEQIRVELRGNGVVYDTVTLNAENNWRHHWPELPRLDTGGNEIEWSIVELEVEDYLLTVTMEGVAFLLTNTYSPDDDGAFLRRSVMKVWDDRGYEDERPASIRVHLLRNGEVVDTRTLDASNQWQTAWEDLPRRDGNGDQILWSIQEETVEGYRAAYTVLGEHTVLTNSVDKPALPQTGLLWWPVPALAALGLLMLILGRLAKGRAEDA